MLKNITLFLLLISISTLSAQKLHTVEKGDTPYSLTKKYDISLSKLYEMNPTIKDGILTIGDQLRVDGLSNELGQIIIQPKQTIYGITKKFKISETDLRKLNPDLDNHMKIGDLVTLPKGLIQKYGADQPISDGVVEQKTKTSVLNSNPPLQDKKQKITTTSVQDDYLTYTVQDGDTVFGILHVFNITLENLLQLNPELNAGLKTGMVLKIKKLDSVYSKKSGDILNVVLMLPFGYDSNDSKYRTVSLQFLQGAKLAIERNAAKGKKMNIKVIDAGTEATFKKTLSKIDRENTDLIIGPLFKSSVLEVLDYVKVHRIPVVAPFANTEELHGYSNLVMIETQDEVYAEKIAEEVKSIYSNQKIYILAGSDKTYANMVKESILKRLKNTNIEIVNTASEIKAETNMMTGLSAPIIAILAEKNEKLGNTFAEKMIELSKETTGIKAFSMYHSNIFNDKENDLKKVNLVYLMDTKIDTNGSFENEILTAYKKKYCETPGKFAVKGFDIVNDILSRENEKAELFKQISKPQKQLSTKFDFKRISPNGAYINTGYQIIKLTP